MNDISDEDSGIEESDSEKSADDCRQIKDAEEAMTYTKEIVDSYNNSDEKWNLFN